MKRWICWKTELQKAFPSGEVKRADGYAGPYRAWHLPGASPRPTGSAMYSAKP